MATMSNQLLLLDYIMKIRDSSDRKTVLDIFLKDNKFKKMMREIALNVVEKNVPLNDKNKRMLSKYKSALWKLKSRHSVRKVIQQEGEGFLSILLPIVGSLIASKLITNSENDVEV